MQQFQQIVGSIIMIAGTVFFIIGTIGLLRFPDFYSRMHATGKCDTLGSGLVLLGVAIHQDFTINTVKLFLIISFIFIVNPTSTHVLAKAAYGSGLIPWTKSRKNK